MPCRCVMWFEGTACLFTKVQRSPPESGVCMGEGSGMGEEGEGDYVGSEVRADEGTGSKQGR